MSDIAIRVENLSKRYPSTWLRAGRIGQRKPYKALRGVLPQLITAPFFFLRRHSPFAIRDSRLMICNLSGPSKMSPSR